jgi:hypothetical protein
MRGGRTRVAAATLGLLAAAIAPAGAAAAPGPVYGGGTSQDDPFAVIVSKDHRRLVRLLAHVDLGCADASRTAWSGSSTFAGRARISRTGRVAVRATTAQDGAPTLALDGRLTGAGARGTIRVTTTLADPTTGAKTACDSGRVTWRTRSARGSVFAGLTSAGHPVVVELAADRLSVQTLRYSWDANCHGGGFLALGDHFSGFPLGPRGSFGASFLPDPVDLGAGAHRNPEYAIHGRVGKTEAGGTFSLVAIDTDATGATTDTCTTGRETWRALS